jgi:hypothetical protein
VSSGEGPKNRNMRELHYADGTLLVSDDVCHAVFVYAVALAKAGDADLITVPILWNGRRDTANLVLGPASQLFCSPTNTVNPGADLEDDDLVAELTRRTALLGPEVARAAREGDGYFEPPELD